MTRTDASPDYLQAWLDHHLQVCEKAFLLACIRPDQDIAAVKAVCDQYGDRVRLEVTRHPTFDCWRTVSELRRWSHQLSSKFVLHIDKDEFIADFSQFPRWCRGIDKHELDSVVGDMIWRTAPGCKSFDVRGVTSFAELDLLAPIRAKQGNTKCYLTGGDILLHNPTPGARIAVNPQPVEHFAASLDFMEKAVVKARIPRRDTERYLHRMSAMVHMTPSDCEKVVDSPHLLLRSNAIIGWTNYVDLLRDAAKFLPENGVYVETGVFAGKSLGYLAEFLQVLGKPARMVGYDVFNVNFLPGVRAFKFNPSTSEEWMEFARANLVAVAPWNTPEIARCDGALAAQHHEDASVDFVWLDSSHTEEHLCAEITAWLPKLKPSGILAGHDLAPTHPGVEAGLRRSGIEFEPILTTSWIRKGDVAKLMKTTTQAPAAL